MSDWTVLEPATEAKAGKVKHARSYPSSRATPTSTTRATSIRPGVTARRS